MSSATWRPVSVCKGRQPQLARSKLEQIGLESPMCDCESYFSLIPE